MLIDTRQPPEPDGDRPLVELDWRLWSWVVAGIVLFLAATAVPGIGGVGLAFAGFASLCKALESFIGRYGHGLAEWRQ